MEKKMESVGLGSLGLQRYANQNWISHILTYLAEAANAELNCEFPLLERLLELTASHETLLKKITPRIYMGDQIVAPTMVSSKALEALDTSPETRDLIRRVLYFQESFSARQLIEGPDILAVDSDPTLFSLADSNHQSFVEILIGATTSPIDSLTQAELIAFKSQFGSTAFICPVKGCVRGFSSAIELNNHKSHRHKQRLRCYEGKCVHNELGFAGFSSLQQHVEKVHNKETPRIPTAIKRRKGVEEHGLALPWLADLDMELLSPRYKKVKDDWYVIFNPALPRLLDVDLVNTLVLESMPCCVRFSMDGRFVATACDKSARVYDAMSGEILCLLEQYHDIPGNMLVMTVCFSPDGKYLATGAEDGVVRVWDISSCTVSNTFLGHGDGVSSGYRQGVNSVDFSPDGRIVASGGVDSTVRLWDVESSSNILTFRAEEPIIGVAISPDGQLVAAGSVGKSVRVWTLQGDPILQHENPHEHKDSVYSVAFSTNGTQLVTGSLDRTAKMWELDSSSHVKAKQALTYSRTFDGHRGEVYSVAMTPDTSWVLSASADDGVHFWDANTGDCQFRVMGHNASVESVSVSPTDAYFATASWDMKIRIWRYTNLALEHLGS